jgi:hypothetical protein
MNFFIAFSAPALNELGKATIIEYIQDLQSCATTFDSNTIIRKENSLELSDASDELITKLLWTALVYFKTNYELSPNRKKQDALAIIGGVINDYTGKPTEVLVKSHPLFQKVDKAVALMKKHVQNKEAKKEKSNKQEKYKQQETSPSQTAIEETAALQAKISQQTKDIKELKAEIENLRNQLDQKQSTQADWYEGEFESLPAETEFVLRERVVFFATVLSLDFNKKYTVLANLAAFIEALCNDQHSVAPFITKMKRDSEAAANAKAAKKVAGLLKAIIPDEYKQDEKLTINKIIESMKANFPEKEE